MVIISSSDVLTRSPVENREVFYHDDARSRAYEHVFDTYGFYPHSDDEITVIRDMKSRGALKPGLSYADRLSVRYRGKDVAKILNKEFERLLGWFNGAENEQISLYELRKYIDQVNISDRTGVESVLTLEAMKYDEEIHRAVLALMRLHETEDLVRYRSGSDEERPEVSVDDATIADMIGARTVRGLRQRIALLLSIEQKRELYWEDRMTDMYDHGLIHSDAFEEKRARDDIINATR